MDYNTAYDPDKENKENQETSEKMATLESIFNDEPSKGDFADEMFKDPLENTANINDLDLDQLRKYSDQLKNAMRNEGFSIDDSNAEVGKYSGVVDEGDKNAASNDYSNTGAEEYSGAVDEMNKSNDYSNGGESYGGRQKVLTPANKAKTNSLNKDLDEILVSFVSCSILSFVTAAMGVGFILNIIIQTR